MVRNDESDAVVKLAKSFAFSDSTLCSSKIDELKAEVGRFAQDCDLGGERIL